MSLILVLLFSFLLTVLEGARIRGASAYVSMVSELGGDSFLGSYYYPLFQEYRLFGVFAGDGEGYLTENALLQELEPRVCYGLQEIDGGLLSFDGSKVRLGEYRTLLTGNGAEFLSQVRRQVELDGLSLAISELFSEEMFTEAGTVGKIYRAQEETMTATANVTRELLKLMEQVDGIRMGDYGFSLDKDGRLQVNDSFIKQLNADPSGMWEKQFGNEEVYRTVSKNFYPAEEVAEKIMRQVQSTMELKREITQVAEWITYYKNHRILLLNELEEEEKKAAVTEFTNIAYIEQLQREIAAMDLAITNASREKTTYESQRKNLIREAEENYQELKKKLDGVEATLKSSRKTLDNLEKQQKTAKAAVAAYEMFLEGTISRLSEELKQVFLQELHTMKLYVGMEEQGYSVPDMRRTVEADLALLEGFSLQGFSEQQLSRVVTEMREIVEGMQRYTVDGLWFTYGDIVVADVTGKNVWNAISELLTTGVLSLVGVSEKEQSDRTLSGKSLPSEGMGQDTLLEELFYCIAQAEELMQSQTMADAVKAAGNAVLDATVLELYCMKYFYSFLEDAPHTRLNYEREYLIFGKNNDKTNLLYMVLYLVAIRTLFSMVALLKQPGKMTQLDTLAAGVSGLTGIPAVGAAVKYSLLFLWSVEEALVEVAALLQGKRIPVIGMGMVSFEELFLMNKIRIAEKAGSIPNGIGAAYQDYLALLSLTRTTKQRTYRALDLIQENICYRYEDSFRIRTVVTKISFYTTTTLKPLFDTGFFSPGAYAMEWLEESAY